MEYHHAQIVVVRTVLVERVDAVGLDVVWVERQSFGTYQCESSDYHRVVDDEDDEIFVSGGQGYKGLSHF